MTFLQGLMTSGEAIGKLFLVAMVGFVFSRRKLVSDDAFRGMTQLLIDVIVPCALCVNMVKGFKPEILTDASPMLLCPALFIPLTTLGCLLYYRVLHKGTNRGADYGATALASIPNSIYIPLPVALAVTPPEMKVQVSVLVGAAVMAINPLQWTLGSFLVTTGEKREVKSDWRKSLLHIVNGPVIGIMAGLALSFIPAFVSAAKGEPTAYRGLRLVMSAMEFLGQCMAPLAMVVLGAMVANCELRRVFSWRLVLPVALFRFVLVPGAVYALIRAGQIPVEGVAGVVLMIECASPSATNLALAARRFGGEWEVVSGILLIVNTLALLALPFWMALGLQLK